MLSVRFCQLTLVLFLLSVSTLSFTNAQSVRSDPETDEFTHSPTSLTIDTFFTPSELSAMRSSDAVTLSPLKFEEKIAESWIKGQHDAMKKLADSATKTDGGIESIESLLSKNADRSISMTPEQLEQQVAWAYQLGGLHSINRVRKYSNLDLPPIRIACDDELNTLRLQYRRMMKSLRYPNQRQHSITQYKDEESAQFENEEMSDFNIESIEDSSLSTDFDTQSMDNLFFSEFDTHQSTPPFPSFYPDPTDEPACSPEKLEKKRCPLIFGRRKCQRRNEEIDQIRQLCENDRQLARAIRTSEDRCKPRRLLPCSNVGCLRFNWVEMRRQSRCAKRSIDDQHSNNRRRA